MAFSLGTANYRLRRQAPVTRLTASRRERTPIWPTVVVVLLLCLPSIFGPIVLTVLNAVLVALAAVALVAAGRALDTRLMVLIALVAAVATLGLVMGRGAVRYEYLKDLWYVTNPLLVILTGYVLYVARPDLAALLRGFVVAGLIIGLWQMRGYFVDPSIVLLPAVTIRSMLGTGSHVVVLALAILIVCSRSLRESVRMPVWIAVAIFVFIALSVIGTFSRTAVALVMVALAAALGGFVRREWLRIGLPFVIFVALSLLVVAVFDTDSDRALQTFTGKLARSLAEMTVAEGLDVRGVNVNFRAYETNRVIEQFAAAPPLEMIFGQGFGAMVDLGITMPLIVSDTGYRGVRHIGIFHNGYVYLITKVGLVGLLLYLGFLLYLYVEAKANSIGRLSVPEVAAARLFQAVVVSLAVSTYFVSGLFNRDNMFSYLLITGVLLAHLARVRPARRALDSGEAR